MTRYSLFVICLIGLLFNFSSAQELPVYYGQEIVVTASRIPQLKSESPASVSIITKEEIKTSGAKNAVEALRSTMGIDVKSNGFLGSASSVRLRGATYQQVLVLIDGRRTNSPLLGGTAVEDLLVDNIEKIEVVRGPASSLYGADAVGGVVNIITQKPKDTETEVEILGGSFGTQKYKVSTSGKGVCNYLISLGFLKSDGFRVNGDYQAQSFTGSLGNSDLNFNFNTYLADKGLPGVPENAGDPASSSTPSDRQGDRNYALDLTWQTGELMAKVFQYRADQRTHLYDFWASQFTDTEYASLTRGLDLQSSFKGKKSSLLLGLDWREDWGQSAYAGSHIVNNLGVFTQSQFGGLTGGVRVDRHSVAGSSISPRVGAVWPLSQELTLKTSLGWAFRAPTLNDLYWNDPIWQMYGATDLKPERAQTLDIGLESKLGFSLHFYTSYVKDLIVWDTNWTTFVTQARNLSGADLSGIEFEYIYGIGFLNYTYQRANNLDPRSDPFTGEPYLNKDLAYTPKHKYNVGIRCEGCQLTLRYIGERFADALNRIKLPGYAVVDAGLYKEFGKLSLNFLVENLFNEDYQESLGWHPVTYEVRGYPMPLRRWSLGVSYSF